MKIISENRDENHTFGTKKNQFSNCARRRCVQINKSIRKEVSNSSVSFWLDLELKSLINRLKKTKRPLLDKENFESTINGIT